MLYIFHIYVFYGVRNHSYESEICEKLSFKCDRIAMRHALKLKRQTKLDDAKQKKQNQKNQRSTNKKPKMKHLKPVK